MRASSLVAWTPASDFRPPIYEELERNVAEQARVIEQQARRIAELEKRIGELTRAGKRQAARFRKAERTERLGKAKRRENSKPGRQPGDENGKHRRREELDAEPDEVQRATLPESCPYCDRKRLVSTKAVTQTQIDLPQNPIVRRFDIKVGECRVCGRGLSSTG